MKNRKNILITGASSGLGSGMAKEFAKQDCNLALCARRLENLEKLKEELLTLNPNINVFIRTLDVTLANQVFEVFEAFNSDFQSINQSLDRIIVNAGIGEGAAIGTGGHQSNMQTATVNFCGAINQLEAGVSIFRNQNFGHLVVVSSMSAFRGCRSSITVYGATKAGVASLAEGISLDLLKTPIKVTTLFPGYIKTEINEDVKKPLPFIIPLEKGAKLLVKAINKEKSKAYIPFYPWYFIRKIMPLLPLKTLRKL